jgi:hypothetical protein
MILAEAPLILLLFLNSGCTSMFSSFKDIIIQGFGFLNIDITNCDKTTKQTAPSTLMRMSRSKPIYYYKDCGKEPRYEEPLMEKWKYMMEKTKPYWSSSGNTTVFLNALLLVRGPPVLSVKNYCWRGFLPYSSILYSIT